MPSIRGIKLVGRYRVLVPLASLLPESSLRYLHRRWPVGFDPTDGWSLWLDASYHKYVRNNDQNDQTR